MMVWEDSTQGVVNGSDEPGHCDEVGNMCEDMRNGSQEPRARR